jgi:threonine/homoserine/homoserine lactone efflux protein
VQQCGVAALSDVASFAVVAGLLTITPGLDTALVVRTAVTQGRRQGFAVASGIETGVLVWGVAAAVGISALLVASRLAYDTVRALGAAYLIWLGATMLWRTWRRRDAVRRDAVQRDTVQRDTVPRGAAGSRLVAPSPQESAPRSWFRGVTTNLLNPKIGAFYLAMLPQFIPAHASHLLMGLLLAGIHDAEGVIWFTALIFSAHLARRFLASDRAHKVMDRITGTVLIGFGLKLALSNR